MSDIHSIDVEDDQFAYRYDTQLLIDRRDEDLDEDVIADYITEHFYTCSPKILNGLGKMYAGGGELTKNIDTAGGTGTAEFTSKAIEHYCG